MTITLPPARRAGDALVRKQRAAVAALAGWTDQAFIGELGWPHNAPDTEEWNALGADFYRALASHAGAPKGYSIAQTATVEALRVAKATGCDEAIIDANWSAFGTRRPSQNGLDAGAVAATNALIAEARRLGMRVILSINPQYCNEWVAANVPPFKDQNGAKWTGTASDGYNVRDWVFTAAGGVELAAFIFDLGERLDPVDAIRIGGGIYGELQYPPTVGANPRWWSFGDAAQTGVGLADGMTVCPTPGVAPYASGEYDVATRAFVVWHIRSLATFAARLVATVRVAFPTQRIYVLHPSYGLRRNLDPASEGYRDDASKGTDPAVMIPAYLAAVPDGNVRPWCTSGDHAGNYEPNATNPDKPESDWAAWYHLERVAAANGITDGLRAENTDGAGDAGMARMFSDSGVLGRDAYSGAMWLHYGGLIDGSQGTLTTLKASIQRRDPRAYVTGWGDSDWFGPDYPLSAYDLSEGAKLATATVHEAARAYPELLVGRNLAGAEMGGRVPGVAETDYHYPTAANMATMRALGYDMVRVPLLWERVQPVLGAGFDPAAVAAITALLDAALAQGLRVVPELHNYGRYKGGALTTADALFLVGFWVRFLSYFGAHPALWGIGLMNEPHGLGKEERERTSGVLYDFRSGPGTWTGSDESVTLATQPGGGIVVVKQKPTDGYTMIRLEDHDPRTVSAAGATALIAQVYTPIGTPGDLRASVRYQDSRWGEQRGKSQYCDAAGRPTSGLVAGQVTTVTTMFDTPIGADHHGIIIQIEGRGQPAGVLTLRVDSVSAEYAAAALSPAQVWETIARTTVQTIRSSGYGGLICVPAYDWSHLQGLTETHPQPFIPAALGPVRMEAHAYADADLSGRYLTGFAAALRQAQGEGW